jgi:hypothetical protein
MAATKHSERQPAGRYRNLDFRVGQGHPFIIAYREGYGCYRAYRIRGRLAVGRGRWSAQMGAVLLSCGGAR